MKSTNKINPIPKHIEQYEWQGNILPRISCEPNFLRAAKVFAGYSERLNNIKFSFGDGGIALMLDKELKREEYRVVCGHNGIEVYASEHKGMSNALSVLLQLTEADEDKVSFPGCRIEDRPDSEYRGFMLDTARYPHSMDMLFRYIDLCYFNRASHFQIHFSDDQNFTIALPEYPKLKSYYSADDLQRLDEYAGDRGITIVPEIDVPGHTECLIRAYPEIFGEGHVLSADSRTFEAIQGIFTYIHELFPNSPLIHIGGDEANIGEWERCERSKQYMAANEIASTKELYAEYIRIVTEMIFKLGCTPVVWEGFAKEYNDKISKDVIVIAWESFYQPAYDLADGGFRIINCSWEPLYVVTGARHFPLDELRAWNVRSFKNWWEKSLAYPDGFVLSNGQAKILGGQLCAWGDKIAVSEEPEKMTEEEYELVAERLPVLCERTWNI